MFTQPQIMGIVNLTKDSFYDGGKYTTTDNALKQVDKLIQEGANIIDLGAQSTKPGATLLEAETEWQCLLPVLEAFKFSKVHFSVDTFYASVAEKAIRKGVTWINDISGGRLDAQMLPIIFDYQPVYVWMHSRGTPQTMNTLTQYDNVVEEVYQTAAQFLITAQEHGFYNTVIDVGFGFAKTVEQNYHLLRDLQQFKQLQAPLLVGLSRKSMIYKPLNIQPEDALAGTCALNLFALQQGADILRVHDVTEAQQMIRLHQQLTND